MTEAESGTNTRWKEYQEVWIDTLVTLSIRVGNFSESCRIRGNLVNWVTRCECAWAGEAVRGRLVWLGDVINNPTNDTSHTNIMWQHEQHVSTAHELSWVELRPTEITTIPIKRTIRFMMKHRVYPTYLCPNFRVTSPHLSNIQPQRISIPQLHLIQYIRV